MLSKKIPCINPDFNQIPESNGSGCETFILQNKETRLYVKKLFNSSLENLNKQQEQYHILKEKLGAIVPEALFIHTKGSEFQSIVIMQYVQIIQSVPEELENDHLKTVVEEKEELQQELEAFTQAFFQLKEEGKIVDVVGENNLVITSEGLRYIDSVNPLKAYDSQYKSFSEKIIEKIQNVLRRDEDKKK
jgi:hypothetical protein